MTKIADILHKDVCAFMIISHGILLRINNFSNIVKKSKHIKKIIFQNSCHSRDMWKNMVIAEQATDDNIILRMHFARWTIKVTDTHSEFALPQQNY